MVCPWRRGGEATPVLLSGLAAIPAGGWMFVGVGWTGRMLG